MAYVSPDGIHWKRLVDQPVLTQAQVPFRYMFDSQNLAFWSEAESQYVCFFRVFQDDVRRICRTSSADFVHWSTHCPQRVQLNSAWPLCKLLSSSE